MKLYSLIPVVLLGMAVLVQAQPVTTPPASKAGVAKDPNMNADGSVTLSSGRLVDVVAEIERRIGHWPGSEGSGKPAMPNIFNGPDTREAMVPGDLRLRDVSPLQAVALAAAAADCMLEPIFAPMEASDVPAGKAIGYRIVRGPAQKFTSLTPSKRITSMGGGGGVDIFTSDMAAATAKLRSLQERYGANHPSVSAAEKELVQLQRALEQSTVESKLTVGGVGLALAKTNGSIVVGQVVPGSPASSSPDIRPGQRILRVAEGDQEAVEVTGLELEKVVQLIRGASGTVVKITLGGDSDKGPTENVVTLKRSSIPVTPPSGTSAAPKVKVVDPLVDSFGASGGGGGGMTPAGASSGMNSGFANRRISSVQAARGNEPFVRVYAIGFIMTGTEEEKVTKVKAVDELIRQALNAASLDLNPDLNIHQRTGTLISKASPAQHEIIEQAVQAMKENATQLAAPAKP